MKEARRRAVAVTAIFSQSEAFAADNLEVAVAAMVQKRAAAAAVAGC